MFEEFYTETFSLMSTWNQTWNIFEYERFSLMIQYSEIWSQSRKWIISNLWSDITQFWDESWFTSRWDTDNTDICNEAFAPCIFCFPHLSPVSAVRTFLYLYSESVLRLVSMKQDHLIIFMRLLWFGLHL